MSQQFAGEVTLSELKTLIAERKIAKFKKYFPQASGDTIDKMFYCFEPSGYKNYMRTKPSIQHFVYTDNERFVVRSLRGYYPSRGYYHAMYVIGIDNKQAWIHRLQWDKRMEDKSYNWTEQDINQLMGFTESLTIQTVFKKGDIVRVQGDLSVIMVNSMEGVIIDRFSFHFLKRREEIKVILAERDSKCQELDKDIKEAEEFCECRFEGIPLAKLALKEFIALWKKYDMVEDKRRLTVRLGYSRTCALLDRIEGLREQRANEVMNERVSPAILKRIECYADKQTEQDIEGLREQCSQVNLRFGNHLVIIHNALEMPIRVGTSDLNLNGILIPEQSCAFVIHDEHENRTMRMPAGIYAFRLLTRHMMDRR